MRNLVKPALLSLSLTTLAALTACGGDKPPQEPSSMNTTAAPAMPPAPTEPAPTTMTTPAEPPAPSKPAEKPLTDAEILMFTSTANSGEVEMAQLAAKQASNADVKNFAAMMITQHRDMETKGKALATKAKITPADSDVSMSLKSDVSSTVSTLKNQKGKDFDKAYMDAQVKAHRDVLAVFDAKLLPNAQNTELKAALTDARGHIAAHLTKAQDIQSKLDTGNASTPAMGTTPAKPKK